jgi:PAS domain S-box-containing protein
MSTDIRSKPPLGDTLPELPSEATQLGKANQSLYDSEERFRLLVESVQDYAILMLDPTGNVVSWNLGTERIKGYTASDILGKNFSVFYPKEDILSGKPAMELAQATKEGRFEDEGWRLRKDGSRFWANVVLTALYDANGEVRGFSKVSRDITDRKQSEQALRDKNVELQNSAESKNRFLANMSHELRTPLNGIIGFAEFLTDGKPGTLNPKQKEYLAEILNSGRHLLQLINDVLDLAKVEANRMELHPESFSLAKAIEGVCAVAKPLALKKAIKITIRVEPEVDDVVLDQQKFKQVLYNLVSNAVKFTDDGGQVAVVAAVHDEAHFKLVVSDTGIGIKAEDFPRLFTEFEQLESGAARHYEGTGLGLALTRKIVQLQGGTIGVESDVGNGSSFSVILPMNGNTAKL